MNKIKTWIVITVLLAGMQAAAAVENAEKALIRLSSEYIVKDVTKTAVRLGEIAENIQCADTDFLVKIANLVIMEAPKPGTQQRLAQHQVILAVRTAGYDFFRLGFEGPSLIEVYGPGQRVTAKDIVNAVEKKILDESGINHENLLIEVLTMPAREPWLPPQDYEVSVNRISPSWLGTSRYIVRFLIDSVAVHEEHLVVKVSHRRKVFMPADSLKRGDIITMENIREETQYIDKQQYDKLYVDSLEALVGKKCRTNINKYEPFKWSSLEDNYVIQNGATVLMVMRTNGLLLQTPVKAQFKGAPGDVIPVLTQGTNKLVKAKVINQNLVEKVSS